MTLCPVAIAVGCKKCPIFTVCPAKGVIGDYKPAEPGAGKKKSASSKSGH
ncbi:MAG: hypothetical protein ACOZDY_05095 [Pseudomonadota bacterium]